MSRDLLPDAEPERPRRADRGGARRDRGPDHTAVPARSSIAPDDVLEAVFVGNPVMHHLFLGIDPTAARAGAVRAGGLRRAAVGGARPRAARSIRARASTSCPASPAMSAPTRRRWRSPKARSTTRRSRSSSMSAPTRKSCSATATRVLAASSPTGPAFEGAQISAGQRAAPGAIERVRIDPVTLEPRFKVIGVDAWSDEPGFDDGDRDGGRHRHLRLRHHRGRGGNVPRRDHRRRGADRRPACRPLAAHRGRRAHVRATGCGTGRCRSRSPRTTSARSSSPRARSMPARGC